MNNTYVEGINKSRLDDKITRKANTAKRRELGGKEMVVAIQNENGDIYRVISVEGMGAYIHLAMELTGLGLIDLHAENLNPGKYDSLFIFKK